MAGGLIAAAAEGFALSAGSIIAIGAQNLFVLKQGLKRQHVLAIVLFCAAADAFLITAGVSGLGEAIALIPQLSLALSLGGAAFLLWYGVTSLRRASVPTTLIVEKGVAISLGTALAGMATFTFLNPHVYIDTVMVMGAFGTSLPAAERMPFVVGAVCASCVWFTALGFGARALTPLFAKPMAWRTLDLAIGAMMIGLSVNLLRGAVAP
jgi:L-lysine exporter family protein LysE/ArgO